MVTVNVNRMLMVALFASCCVACAICCALIVYTGNDWFGIAALFTMLQACLIHALMLRDFREFESAKR